MNSKIYYPNPITQLLVQMKFTTHFLKNYLQFPRNISETYITISGSQAISLLYGSKLQSSPSSKNNDPTNPTSYRPIALTSCACKTLERMINQRLIWFLESNKLLSNLQAGFRTKRSTMDQVVHIETLIRETCIKKGTPGGSLF